MIMEEAEALEITILKAIMDRDREKRRQDLKTAATEEKDWEVSLKEGSLRLEFRTVLQAREVAVGMKEELPLQEQD